MSLEKAREHLDDAIKNGTAADVHYWRGYVDALLSVRRGAG